MTPAERRAWRLSVLKAVMPAHHRLVLLALHECADYQDGTNAWPGRDTLAHMSGASPSTVDRALAAGLKLGLIERTANGYRGQRPVYRLLPQPECASAVTHIAPGLRVSSDAHSTGKRVSGDDESASVVTTKARHSSDAPTKSFTKSFTNKERGLRPPGTSLVAITSDSTHPLIRESANGKAVGVRGPFGPRCPEHVNVEGYRACPRCQDARAAAKREDQDRKAAIRVAIDNCKLGCDPAARLWNDDDTDWVDCPGHSNFRLDALIYPPSGVTGARDDGVQHRGA